MGWVTTYNQSNYQVEFYWAILSQNPIANTSSVRINGSRVRSTNASYSFYNESGSATTNFGISANGSQTLTGANSFKTGGRVSTSWREYWFTGVTRTVTHDSNGNASVAFHHAFNSGVTTYNPPNFGWRDSTQWLTKIDRGVPGLSLAASAIYNTSATIKLTVAGAPTDQVRYRRSASEGWTTISSSVAAGGSTLVTVGGLFPRTNYTLSFQVRRSYNHIWSGTPGITITTDADAPSSVQASSISASITSAAFVLEATAGTNNPINGYAYAVSTSTSVPSSFTTYSTAIAYLKRGLTSNTQYYLFVRARATNGKVTTSDAIGFKTLPTNPVPGEATLTSRTSTSLAVRASGHSAQGGINKIVYRLYNSSGILQQISPNITVSPYNHTFSGLGNYTDYKISIVITDNLGRVVVGSFTNFRTLSVISNNSLKITNITQTTVTATSLATSQSGIQNYSFSSNDGYTYVTNGKIDSYTFLNLSPNTSYQIKARITDNDGNISESPKSSITTLPLIPEITSIELTNHRVKDLAFTIHTKQGIPGSTVQKYQYHFWDDEGTTDISNTSISPNLEFHELKSNKVYYLEVYAIDTHGQSSETMRTSVKTKAGKWLKASVNGASYQLANVYLIFEDGSHYLVDKESVKTKENI